MRILGEQGERKPELSNLEMINQLINNMQE